MEIAWGIAAAVVGILLTIAFSAVGYTPAEFRLARWCLVISALVLGGVDIVWQFTTSMPWWWRGIVGISVGGLIFIGLPEGLRWIARRQQQAKLPVATGKSTNSLIDPQLKLLESIDEFIATKDEGGLRELFDFPNLLKYNILFARRNLFPGTVSASQSEDIDRYFTGGQARLDIRYARMANVNNRLEVEWLPGRIGVINTSVKYNESRHKLVELYSSANVPATVSVALKELDDVVEKDSILMIESLNDSMSTDPRYISENDRYGSRFYGSASGAYWTRFISLGPKGDAVRLYLRDYLNTK